MVRALYFLAGGPARTPRSGRCGRAASAPIRVCPHGPAYIVRRLRAVALPPRLQRAVDPPRQQPTRAALASRPASERSAGAPRAEGRRGPLPSGPPSTRHGRRHAAAAGHRICAVQLRNTPGRGRHVRRTAGLFPHETRPGRRGRRCRRAREPRRRYATRRSDAGNAGTGQSAPGCARGPCAPTPDAAVWQYERPAGG